MPKLSWREIDAPRSHSPRRPASPVLNSRTVKIDLQATMRMDYPPDGLEYEIIIPVHAIGGLLTSRVHQRV